MAQRLWFCAVGERRQRNRAPVIGLTGKPDACHGGQAHDDYERRERIELAKWGLCFEEANTGACGNQEWPEPCLADTRFTGRRRPTFGDRARRGAGDCYCHRSGLRETGRHPRSRILCPRIPHGLRAGVVIDTRHRCWPQGCAQAVPDIAFNLGRGSANRRRGRIGGRLASRKNKRHQAQHRGLYRLFR